MHKTPSFSLKGESVPVLIGRTDRKTFRVSVNRDGAIRLFAPHLASDEKCQAFLHQSRHWIAKQRAAVLAMPSVPAFRYVAGESHLYLGKPRRLKTPLAAKTSVKLDRAQLVVSSRGEPEPRVVQALLEKWYRLQALDVFQVRLMACLQNSCFSDEDRPSSVRIKKLRSSWGSMSKAGVLTLSMDLIKAPIECIDYVITHELCHIRIPRHGPEFWKSLTRAMPDWKSRRKLLEDMLG